MLTPLVYPTRTISFLHQTIRDNHHILSKIHDSDIIHNRSEKNVQSSSNGAKQPNTKSHAKFSSYNHMGNDQSTLHHNRYFTNSGYKNRKSESQILSGSKVACSTTNSLNVSNHTIVDKSSLSYRGSNSKITTRRVSATTDTSPTLVNKKKRVTHFSNHGKHIHSSSSYSDSFTLYTRIRSYPHPVSTSDQSA